MNWLAPAELFREHPGKMATASLTIVLATLAVGNWIWDAEACHAQTKEHEKTLVEVVEFQRAIVREKEALSDWRRLIRGCGTCFSRWCATSTAPSSPATGTKRTKRRHSLAASQSLSGPTQSTI